MSKFKIEHGASKINLVLLKTNIEDTISNEIDMLASWSNNDRKFIVNELLRFALAQEEDFQKYKVTLPSNAGPSAANVKPAPAPVKSMLDPAPNPGPSAVSGKERG